MKSANDWQTKKLIVLYKRNPKMFADTCVWSSFASVYSDCLVYFEDPAVCIKTVIIQCFCQNSYLFAFKID